MKQEQWRVHCVVGGDRLTYDNDPSSPAANLLDAKILLNSVISDSKHGARFITANLKDHFLASPMKTKEYMRIPFKILPQDIIDFYDLNSIVHEDGYVYVEIQKGMYGLKQAALLAYDELCSILIPAGYHPIPSSLSMWKHTSRKTIFSLCVDDFGIKTYNKVDTDHLLNVLRTRYKITTDWSSHNYCGLTLKWDYKNQHVDVSIPNYIPKLLTKLKHPAPKHKQFSPHTWTTPTYGQKRQYAKIEKDSPYLDAKETKKIQQIAGSTLYYSKALDHSALPALTEIQSSQAKPTTETQNKIQHLLDYFHSNPNTIIRYKASKMILYVDSDAAYLVMPRAKSRIAGHYYLSDENGTPNGPLHVNCRILPHVTASAAETETATMFYNAQLAIFIRRVLQSIGHPQPPTTIHADNTTAIDSQTIP